MKKSGNLLHFIPKGTKFSFICDNYNHIISLYPFKQRHATY